MTRHNHGAKPARKATTVELAYDEVVKDTGQARLINFGDSEVWIPNSQGKLIGKNTIEVPEWLAKKEGLI